jgi:hypothetical protein
MLFTSPNTTQINLGDEQCRKLLLGVCNTKKRGDLSISLLFQQIIIKTGKLRTKLLGKPMT